jgi:hypothetical protein
MNTYLIEKKIYTHAEIFEHNNFTLNGYSFQNWEYSPANGCSGDAWLITKDVSGETMIEAINNFNSGLQPILSRASFISQCGMQYDVNPMFVFKKNDNPESIFFLDYIEESEEVPLMFMEEEHESLIKSLEYEKDAVFDFLTASNNSVTYHSRLVSLIMALEAIAGEKEAESVCKKCGDMNTYLTTDKTYIRDEILKDKDLYEKIYAYKTGIRNAIFHGKYHRTTDGTDYATLIYEKIVQYFNTKYGYKISTDVIGAPRNGLGKYQKSLLWAKPKDPAKKINLKTLLPLYKEAIGVSRSGLPFDDDFEEIRDTPKKEKY